MTEALTGDALKIRAAELTAALTPEGDAAIACGYVTPEGKARVAAFNRALMEAHGLALPKKRGKGGSKGKPLSYSVTTGKTGAIVLAGGYGALIGSEPGGKVDVKHDGDRLILTVAAPVAAAAAAGVELTPF